MTLSDTTSGATIFYTTDGTNPSPSSQVFTQPLSISQTTQIRAYATAPGFSPSSVTSCQYTINIPPGTCAPPQAAPQGATFDNDFPATLTSTASPADGCNICFTLDGSDPACDANGACVAPAQQYNAQNRIPINGTVTGNPAVGQVNLKATTCQKGFKPSSMTPVLYTLKVGTPTLQGPTPDPTLHLYTGNGITPTVATTTSNATGLFNLSAGILATDPNNTSCTNGKPIVGAGGNTLLPQLLPVADTPGNQTLFVVACKPGYQPSTELIGPYTFTLNQPNVGSAVQPGTYDAVVGVTVDSHLNAGATGEFTCATTDGTSPKCNGAACGAGSTKYANSAKINFATDKRAAPAPLNVDGTVVNEIACSPNFAQSTPYASTAYHEQLDKIAFTCCAGLAGSTLGTCTDATKGTGFGKCDAAHSTIPNGGKVWITAAETVVASQEPYDFICSTTDPASTPDCTCDTTAHPNLTKTAATTVTSAGLAAAGAFKAVGCLNPVATQTNGDVFIQSDTPFASQAATGSNQMTQPGIVSCVKPDGKTTCSAATTIPNPQEVQFVNANATGGASAYFCYTINHTDPTDNAGPPPTCYAKGSSPAGGGGASGANGSAATFCTTATTAPGKTSTDGPFGPNSQFTAQQGDITTGTWIEAIACDSANGQPTIPSAVATPVQFQLQVGTPVITGSPAVQFGQAVTITSTTAGALIQYSTDGTTPDCTANFASVTTSNTADANGVFDATYYAMGAEAGGKLVVTGCKTNYTQSAGTANTTFTYTAATPGLFYADGALQVAASHSVTYDDYISTTFQEPPTTGGGASGTWVCLGTAGTVGCSNSTRGQCTGAGSLAIGFFDCTSTALVGATAHSAGQPGGVPDCTGGGNITLPTGVIGFGNFSAIACVPPQPGVGGAGSGATTTVSASGGNSLTFNFANSAVGVTSPLTNATFANVTIAGTKSNTPPAGDHNPPAADTLGATGGCGAAPCPVGLGGTGQFSGTSYICGSVTQTIASLGGQPSNCATFAGTPGTGWTCQASATLNSGLGGAGPTLTLTDQGISATYNFFSCKDFQTWTTGTQAITFTPYVHTPTFVSTGAPADFNTNEGPIAGIDGANGYVTYDANNLYVGYDRGAAIGNTDIIHFYVGSKNGSGTSAADTAFQTGAATLPATGNTPRTPLDFNALYHVYWKADNTAHGTDKWTGASWATAGDPAAVVHNNGSNFVEFSIPLSALAGTAGSYHILGADWNGAAQVGAWPTNNPDTGSTVTPVWTAFQSENSSYAFAPNDAKLNCSSACANVGVTCCVQ